jgi:hypothetical protein
MAETYSNLKLVAIEPSALAGKKLRATFSFMRDGVRHEKHVAFGDRNCLDYTKHRDERLRAAYRAQQDGLDDPTSPNALTVFILYNKPTIRESKKDYRSHFGI